MRTVRLGLMLLFIGFSLLSIRMSRSQDKGRNDKLRQFQRENLVAWCIVPFDGKKRGPAERAAMIRRIGMKRVAYDWRQNHVKEFEQEILEYKKHGIEYFAFWDTHEAAFKLFEKYDLHPQIWKMLAVPESKTQDERVAEAAKLMLPLVERTRKMKCKLGLYNHGGWAGEPENMVAVCKYLRKNYNADHVGVVYNQHHAHPRLPEFAKLLKLMKPYLLCLNLNGMATNGDKVGKKILPLGEGEHDVQLTKVIRDSGYKGPIGIIGHTQDDVEQRLLDNLEGLEWILPQLDGKPAGPKPERRTWKPQKKQISGVLLPGNDEFRSPPITVELRATLRSTKSYNILVASDSKASGKHWEVFSLTGKGTLTAYMPGYQPDHLHTNAFICDNKPHNIGMQFDADRVELFVDGRSVGQQAIKSRNRAAVPGGLAIGRLVAESLGCDGTIEYVRITKGLRSISTTTSQAVPEKDGRTLLLWKPKVLSSTVPTYSREKINRILAESGASGDAHRGLMVFGSAKSACISCHKIGRHGGTVGPDLTRIAKERKPEEIVESVLWPKRTVKKEFIAHQLLLDDGTSHQGYIVARDKNKLTFRDPTKPQSPARTIEVAAIEAEREVGSLMPENLIASMSESQLVDLVALLVGLGTEQGLPLAKTDSMLKHLHGHLHGPTKFPYDKKPLNPEHWPSWQHHVNRDRVYDYYAKEAAYFVKQDHVPPILPAFPGLDGGEQGHWGNQNEDTWASGAWNDTKLGSVISGVFRGGGITVPRGVCVRLGDKGELAVCFNPDSLTYDALWQGGFVKFSSVRHGFVNGILMDGTRVALRPQKRPEGTFKYLGFYRVGKRVVFSYRIGNREILDSPWVENGKFVRQVGPSATHPMRQQLASAPRQWPQQITTKIKNGSARPYAVDTVELPYKNPWNALFFFGGHAFLPDGSALACTMQGDVWHISDLQYPSKEAKWRRFASGLHHALGLVVDEDGIFVLGRDQITRLHDLNRDGEADYYECFSNAYETSPAGHDYICGLERDGAGNFYTASGNQGVVKISADGSKATVVATGFRNPDGIGVSPEGIVTVPCSEGEWTPASMVCAFRLDDNKTTHFFGYRGPKKGKVPDLPFVYFPRGVDNSCGGQTTVTSDKWGPLQGQIVHLSFGTGAHFLLLKDEVDGQLQGAVVPLPGEFKSGTHRGRFNPKDGQLYVCGMQGWGCYTTEVGCFERVRFTGGRAQFPAGFHLHENGILVNYTEELDRSTASNAKSHFAQCWNYRYSAAYGSPEYSTRHFGIRGHDSLAITSASVAEDGKSLFLEIPELQPANQVHLRLQSAPGEFHELFVTAHKLGKPFTKYEGYRPRKKKVLPHPILTDLALATRKFPNPHARRIAGARPITLETGTNLTFADKTIRVKKGEAIALQLSNVDVVPHNWALVKPGTMQRVGKMANRLISDPEAAARQYIPQTEDVLVYTNIVLPRGKHTVWFKAPKQPGRYPYLCTFPGHWMVMNGELIVE